MSLVLSLRLQAQKQRGSEKRENSFLLPLIPSRSANILSLLQTSSLFESLANVSQSTEAVWRLSYGFYFIFEPTLWLCVKNPTTSMFSPKGSIKGKETRVVSKKRRKSLLNHRLRSFFGSLAKRKLEVNCSQSFLGRNICWNGKVPCGMYSQSLPPFFICVKDTLKL